MHSQTSRRTWPYSLAIGSSLDFRTGRSISFAFNVKLTDISSPVTLCQFEELSNSEWFVRAEVLGHGAQSTPAALSSRGAAPGGGVRSAADGPGVRTRNVRAIPLV